MNILIGGSLPPLQAALAAIGTVHVLPGEGPERDAFLARHGADVECLVWPPFIGALPPLLVARLPALRHIAGMGAGYETIDAAGAGARGICVTNTPRAVTDDTADTGLYLILAAQRRFPAAERHLRAGKWTFATPYPRTTTVHGKVLGIVGFGRIGRAVGQRAEACGMTVIYYARTPKPDVSWMRAETLEDLARKSDILLSILPGGEATRGLIGATIFEALGPTGIFVSLGRGTAVDEPALVAALQNGVIAGAGLDVYADEPHVPSELIAMENVVLLPHVGGATDHVIAAVGRDLIENVRAVAEGRAPPDAVPEAPWR